MLWAIKIDMGGGCYGFVCPEEDNGDYQSSYEAKIFVVGPEKFAMLFDTYREACLWIVNNVDNMNDNFEIVAHLP